MRHGDLAAPRAERAKKAVLRSGARGSARIQRLKYCGCSDHQRPAVNGKQKFRNPGNNNRRNNNGRRRAGSAHAHHAMCGFYFALQRPGNACGIARNTGIDAADLGVSQRIDGLARHRQRREGNGKQEGQQRCSCDKAALCVNSHGRDVTRSERTTSNRICCASGLQFKHHRHPHPAFNVLCAVPRRHKTPAFHCVQRRTVERV